MISSRKEFIKKMSECKNSGQGKEIPRTGIDTTGSKHWEEAKWSSDVWNAAIKKMPKRKETGRPIPRNLSEARILILYNARKNGLKVPDDIQKTKRQMSSKVGIDTTIEPLERKGYDEYGCRFKDVDQQDEYTGSKRGEPTFHEVEIGFSADSLGSWSPK